MLSINSKENQYRKPGNIACIGGFLLGSTVANVYQLPHGLLSAKVLDKMTNISKSLTKDEFALIDEALNKAIGKKGLAAKGVSILRATSENSDEIAKIFQKELQSKKLLKILPKSLSNMIIKSVQSEFENGENACYTIVSKKIIMPEKKLGLVMFHEAGHALNANLGKVSKVLHKSKPLTILALPIAMIGLFKTKKASGEEPKGMVDKSTTFIKNNAGKLTFAAFLPTLLEEGMASIKGNKIAKELLETGLSRKIMKTNALGFTTYLARAIGSPVGIALGIKAKDAIAKKKQVEA